MKKKHVKTNNTILIEERQTIPHNPKLKLRRGDLIHQ